MSNEALKNDVIGEAKAQQDKGKASHAKAPTAEVVHTQTTDTQAAMVSQPTATTPPPQVSTGFEANRGYVKRSRGYPVQPGQTWHDLTMAQRKEWFANHENHWKSRFGIENKGLQPNMNWTRG